MSSSPALIRPVLREQINEKFNRGARSQQFLVESIVGAQTLKAASVEPMMQAQWEERLAAYVRTSFDAGVTGALGQNLIQYVSKVTTALILFVGAQSVIEGSMTVGELIAFNMIASQVVQPILRLSQLWQDFQQVQVSVARLGDILNAPPEPVPQNLLTLPPPRGAIEFRNVTMRYRPDAADALRNVSLSIEPGEVIGIVGPSGSGKSTLTKLIQRLYSPQSGQVMIDGVDVAQLDPGWLRRQIGVVLQENILFNRTIHENIALGDPAMPRVMVMQAARLAGADEFIAQLPQGYDTMIEERGANLSGGQRQRIAIARALVTNPRILILDEATSALDYESERIIQENMRSIVRGRTVIIIAHRLAAVRPCTRIVGMQQGRDRRGRRARGAARAQGRALRPPVGAAVRPGEGAGMNERAAPPEAPPPQPRPSRPTSARGHGARPRIPAGRARNPRDAAAAAADRADGDDLRLRAGGAGLVVFRPARRPCDGAGQDRDGRLRQGDRAARSGQDRRDPRREGPDGQGRRPAPGARPGGGRRRRAERPECAQREPGRDRAAPLRDRRRASRRGRRPERAGPARRAQQGRRAAGADSGSVENLAGQAELKVAWDGAVPEPFRLREEAVLRADLAQLSDALKALDRQMAEKLATQKRLDMSIAFQNKLMETLNQRVSTRQQAIDLNVGTKIDLYDAKEELEKSQSALASDQGQLIETDAALRSVRSEKAKTVSQFIADNENKLADAARKADEARQALAKADARLARTRLYAPIDGVVQQMAVTTVGQVVTTGQQLIVLTPIGGKLQVEALVANLDIGFVKPGQDAVIKVDAFPFTRFGALHGKVVNIASAAIAEQDAKRALANATATANAAPRRPARPVNPKASFFR